MSLPLTWPAPASAADEPPRRQADAFLSGVRNVITVGQSGKLNTAIVRQVGKGWVAKVSQVGNGNYTNIYQH